MYYDGLNTDNLSCTLLIRSGCWGHRRSILGTYAAPRILSAAAGLGGVAMLLMSGDLHDWNLLTPNPPIDLVAQQLSTRSIQATWTAPTARGTMFKGYYLRRDNRRWLRVSGHQWTSAPLRTGTHTLSVRSYNERGRSPVRTARIAVN
ncbi:MAG TPA: fibronectin type III domain-containing protein [Marmoricola sp.]|nr:fibronectin type III domain-containing protein [Marmoricola sp.]